MSAYTSAYGHLHSSEVYPRHERENRSYPCRETSARWGRYFGNLNLAEYHIWRACKLAKGADWLLTDDRAGELASHKTRARVKLERAAKLRPPNRLPS